jgi:hypothetical protein
MNLIRSSPPLSFVQSDSLQSGSSSLVSVQLEDLSTSLASSFTSTYNPLILLSHYIIGDTSECSDCFPNVSVMVIRIIQHIASTTTSLRLLTVIAESVSNNDLLTYSCTNALVNGNDAIVQRIWDPRDDVVPMGGYANIGYGEIFSPSYMLTLEPLSISLLPYLTNRSNQDKHRLQDRIEDDIRVAILDLLLSSLMSDRICLCHQLLGLRNFVEHSMTTGSIYHLHSASLLHLESIPNEPKNCLDGLLDLINPQSAMFFELLHNNSEQLMKIFEILYRLCASPLTSALTLTILRIRGNNGNTTATQFLNYHMNIFIKELSVITNMNPSQSSSIQLDVKSQSNKLNCCAWILKIIALELHTMELSPFTSQNKIMDILSCIYDIMSTTSHSMYNLNSRNNTLFGPEDTFNINTNDNTRIPLIKLLHIIPFNEIFVMDNETPLVIQCVQECVIPYSVSYGQQASYGLAKNEPPSGFSTVDITRFQILMKNALSSHQNKINQTGTENRSILSNTHRNEYYQQQQQKQQNMINSINTTIENGTALALKYNLYNIIIAASANISHAWRQLVDVSLLGCGNLLLGISDTTTSMYDRSFDMGVINNASDNLVSSSLTRLITHLILPTLHVLIENPSMEMVLAEQISRSLLTMTSVVRSAVVSNGNHVKDMSPVSDTSLHNRDNLASNKIISDSYIILLLNAIIKALLRRPKSITNSRSNSNIAYRISLYTSFIHILKCNDNFDDNALMVKLCGDSMIDPSFKKSCVVIYYYLHLCIN